MVHAARGEGVQALRWLQSAYEVGERNVLWIELNPMFDSIRDEPGYASLVARMREDVDELRRRVEQEKPTAGER